MTARDQSSPHEEIRLALVLNGGISLAVWMAGVTFELNQCRTATTGEASASRTAWAELLATANRSVAIDMIAGASAGGLNGVILGTAIAREAELAGLKELWMGLAALQAGKLLAVPPRPRWQLLDGDFFQTKIAELLGRTVREPAAEPNVGGRADCVLLVTATAVAMPGVDDPDSRRVYRFLRRDGVATDGEAPHVDDEDDFRPGEAGALTLAARATASFPGAFQPVAETDDLHRRLRSRRVGMPKAPAGGWLMDGGVLDNAPFEPMLDELIDRPVSGAFARHLVYVNPNAGSAPTAPTPAGRASSGPVGTGAEAEPPLLLKTIGATLAAFRQTDRRMDGERLFDATESSDLRSVQPDGVLRALLLDPGSAALSVGDLSTAAGAAFQQYRLSRSAAYCVQHGHQPEKLAPARSAALSTAPFMPQQAPATSAVDPLWSWGLSAAERVLRWWGRVVGQLPETPERTDAYRALYRAQLTVSDWERQRAVIITAIKEGMGPRRKAGIDDLLAGEQAFYTDARRKQLAALVDTAAAATAAAVNGQTGSGWTAAKLITVSLDLDVFTSATITKVDRNAETPRFRNWTIDPGAPSPFPFEAQNAPSWSRRKLCGERWNAFGAFASEDGRRWDYLWGRLDAATTLADQLLAGVDHAVRQSCTDKLVAAILAEECTDKATVAATAKAMNTLTDGGLLALYARTLGKRARGGGAPVAPDSRAAAFALVRGLPSIFFGDHPLPTPLRWVAGLAVTGLGGRAVGRLAKKAQDPWQRTEQS